MPHAGVRIVRCDVTRDGDLEAVVGEIKRERGKIDVVVANAGFGVAGNVEDLDLEDYRRQFETNVFGVLRTIYATLAELKRARGAHSPGAARGRQGSGRARGLARAQLKLIFASRLERESAFDSASSMLIAPLL